MLDENIGQTNFDDINYEELLNEAIRQIPLLNESWTDFNAHDPGIMLLELFSWLTESQRYYLNQITKEHKLKYLKLLGIELKPAEPACLPIVLPPVNSTIKNGAQALIGGIPFTLKEETVLTDTKIAFKRDMNGNCCSEYGFMPFGENPSAGDCFYISFTNPPHTRIRLYIKTMPNGYLKRVPSEEGYCRLAGLCFEALQNDKWCKCEILDKTYGFMQSGEIIINMPFSSKLIRCTLTDCEIDIPPMFERVYPFYAELFQYSEIYGGAENERLKEKGNIVASFKRIESGFIRVGSDVGADLTVYADEPYRTGEYRIEDNQLNLETRPLIILKNDLSLLVLENDGVYRTWNMVEDLSCSSPYDRHYILDDLNGILYFGDNIHGKSAESAVITSLRLTHGSISVKENNKFNLDGIEAINPFPSRAGCAPETPEDAFKRANIERETPYRAVTSEDYKELVLKTPGLCIENVNVYSPENGRLRICVKSPVGKLNNAYLHNIRRWLYPRRLACTELQLSAPSYWECAYNIRLVPEDWALDKENEIKEFIRQYFCALESVFGLTISLQSWTKDLEACPFIKKIDSLTLRRRNGETIQERGEITLSPDGLMRIIGNDISIRNGGA